LGEFTDLVEHRVLEFADGDGLIIIDILIVDQDVPD
jgi:hypothetical protein